jgi:hypothetical protein
VTDDRGLSDVVAFVLTFAIIFTSVGAVTILGFDTLDDVRDQEQIRSMDRTIQGVADSFSDIHRENAPSRSVAVGLEGGSITTQDSSLTIVAETPSGDVSRSVNVGSLVVTPSDKDAEIVYEGGIAYRTRDRGQFVLFDPAISCTARTAVIDVVQLDGQFSVSIAGTVELEGRQRNSSELFPRPPGQLATDATAVEIHIDDTQNPDAWRQYFETGPGSWVQKTGNDAVYRCEGVDAVTVRSTTIAVETNY